MKLFRTDPEEAIQGARTALLQTEQLIGLLQIERGAKIEQAEGDAYVADVAKIDAEIDRLQTSVTAHHDRIAVMQRRQREREQDQRERQKAACIAEIKKALPRRQAAVERVDALLKQLAEAFAALETADEAVFANWAEVMPPAHRFNYLRAMRLDPLSSMRKQRPMSAGLIRELVKRIEQIAAAADNARNAIKQTKKSELAVLQEAHEEKLHQISDAHDKKLAADQKAFEAECAKREQAIKAAEQHVAELTKQAQTDATAAAELKATLKKRLAAMSAAADVT